MTLASLNWSARATEVFANAGIETIEQLTKKPPQEIIKYRNCGKKTLIEIRYRLGKLGLCLKDDSVFTLEAIGTNYAELVERRAALEVEIASIEKQIAAIEEARELEHEMRQALDEDAIYSVWKSGEGFERIARCNSTRKDVVSEICWRKLEADCAYGTNPILPHEVQRRFHCKFCGGVIVATYQSAPVYPVCTHCGKQSKNYFK